MNNDSQYERVFRALGDGHRLTILKQLAQREMNAGEILETVDVVQSTLSHHMKTLCESGLVIPRKSGKWTCYTLDRHALEDARAYLRRLGEETEPEQPQVKAPDLSASAKTAEKEQILEEAPAFEEEPAYEEEQTIEKEPEFEEEQALEEEQTIEEEPPFEEEQAIEIEYYVPEKKKVVKEKNKDKQEKGKGKSKDKAKAKGKEKSREKAKDKNRAKNRDKDKSREGKGK